jgi:hypothetical protein
VGWLLAQLICNIYKASLTDKLLTGSPLEVKDIQRKLKLCETLSKIDATSYKHKNNIPFGGIPLEYIPAWYNEATIFCLLSRSTNQE